MPEPTKPASSVPGTRLTPDQLDAILSAQAPSTSLTPYEQDVAERKAKAQVEEAQRFERVMATPSIVTGRPIGETLPEWGKATVRVGLAESNPTRSPISAMARRAEAGQPVFMEDAESAANLNALPSVGTGGGSGGSGRTRLSPASVSRGRSTGYGVTAQVGPAAPTYTQETAAGINATMEAARPVAERIWNTAKGSDTAEDREMAARAMGYDKPVEAEEAWTGKWFIPGVMMDAFDTLRRSVFLGAAGAGEALPDTTVDDEGYMSELLAAGRAAMVPLDLATRYVAQPITQGIGEVIAAPLNAAYPYLSEQGFVKKGVRNLAGFLEGHAEELGEVADALNPAQVQISAEERARLADRLGDRMLQAVTTGAWREEAKKHPSLTEWPTAKKALDAISPELSMFVMPGEGGRFADVSARDLLNVAIDPDEARILAGDALARGNMTEGAVMTALSTETGRFLFGIGIDIMLDPMWLMGPAKLGQVVAVGDKTWTLARPAVMAARELIGLAGGSSDDAARIVVRAIEGEAEALAVVRRGQEAVAERVSALRAEAAQLASPGAGERVAGKARAALARAEETLAQMTANADAYKGMGGAEELARVQSQIRAMQTVVGQVGRDPSKWVARRAKQIRAQLSVAMEAESNLGKIADRSAPAWFSGEKGLVQFHWGDATLELGAWARPWAVRTWDGAMSAVGRVAEPINPRAIHRQVQRIMVESGKSQADALQTLSTGARLIWSMGEKADRVVRLGHDGVKILASALGTRFLRPATMAAEQFSRIWSRDAAAMSQIAQHMRGTTGLVDLPPVTRQLWEDYQGALGAFYDALGSRESYLRAMTDTIRREAYDAHRMRIQAARAWEKAGKPANRRIDIGGGRMIEVDPAWLKSDYRNSQLYVDAIIDEAAGHLERGSGMLDPTSPFYRAELAPILAQFEEVVAALRDIPEGVDVNQAWLRVIRSYQGSKAQAEAAKEALEAALKKVADIEGEEDVVRAASKAAEKLKRQTESLDGLDELMTEDGAARALIASHREMERLAREGQAGSGAARPVPPRATPKPPEPPVAEASKPTTTTPPEPPKVPEAPPPKPETPPAPEPPKPPEGATTATVDEAWRAYDEALADAVDAAQKHWGRGDHKPVNEAEARFTEAYRRLREVVDAEDYGKGKAPGTLPEDALVREAEEALKAREAAHAEARQARDAGNSALSLGRDEIAKLRGELKAQNQKVSEAKKAAAAAEKAEAEAAKKAKAAKEAPAAKAEAPATKEADDAARTERINEELRSVENRREDAILQAKDAAAYMHYRRVYENNAAEINALHDLNTSAELAGNRVADQERLVRAIEERAGRLRTEIAVLHSDKHKAAREGRDWAKQSLIDSGKKELARLTKSDIPKSKATLEQLKFDHGKLQVAIYAREAQLSEDVVNASKPRATSASPHPPLSDLPPAEKVAFARADLHAYNGALVEVEERVKNANDALNHLKKQGMDEDAQAAWRELTTLRDMQRFLEEAVAARTKRLREAEAALPPEPIPPPRAPEPPPPPAAGSTAAELKAEATRLKDEADWLVDNIADLERELEVASKRVGELRAGAKAADEAVGVAQAALREKQKAALAAKLKATKATTEAAGAERAAARARVEAAREEAMTKLKEVRTRAAEAVKAERAAEAASSEAAKRAARLEADEAYAPYTAPPPTINVAWSQPARQAVRAAFTERLSMLIPRATVGQEGARSAQIASLVDAAMEALRGASGESGVGEAAEKLYHLALATGKKNADLRRLQGAARASAESDAEVLAAVKAGLAQLRQDAERRIEMLLDLAKAEKAGDAEAAARLEAALFGERTLAARTEALASGATVDELNAAYSGGEGLLRLEERIGTKRARKAVRKWREYIDGADGQAGKGQALASALHVRDAVKHVVGEDVVVRRDVLAHRVYALFMSARKGVVAPADLVATMRGMVPAAFKGKEGEEILLGVERAVERFAAEASGLVDEAAAARGVRSATGGAAIEGVREAARLFKEEILARVQAVGDDAARLEALRPDRVKRLQAAQAAVAAAEEAYMRALPTVKAAPGESVEVAALQRRVEETKAAWRAKQADEARAAKAAQEGQGAPVGSGEGVAPPQASAGAGGASTGQQGASAAAAPAAAPARVSRETVEVGHNLWVDGVRREANAWEQAIWDAYQTASQGYTPEEAMTAMLGLMRSAPLVPEVAGHMGQRLGELPVELRALAKTLRSVFDQYERWYRTVGFGFITDPMERLRMWGTAHYVPHFRPKPEDIASGDIVRSYKPAGTVRGSGASVIDGQLSLKMNAAERRTIGGVAAEINAAAADHSIRFDLDGMLNRYLQSGKAISAAEYFVLLLRTNVVRRFDPVVDAAGVVTRGADDVAREAGHVPLFQRTVQNRDLDLLMVGSAEDWRRAGVTAEELDEVRLLLGRDREASPFGTWLNDIPLIQQTGHLEQILVAERAANFKAGTALYDVQKRVVDLEAEGLTGHALWTQLAEEINALATKHGLRHVEAEALHAMLADKSWRLYVPAQTAESMIRLFEDTTPTSAAGIFIKGALDWFNKVYKSWYTVAQTAFTVRNAASNFLTNVLDVGVNGALNLDTQIKSMALYDAANLVLRHGSIQAAQEAAAAMRGAGGASLDARLLALRPYIEGGIDLGDGVVRSLDEAVELALQHNVLARGYTPLGDMSAFNESLAAGYFSWRESPKAAAEALLRALPGHAVEGGMTAWAMLGGTPFAVMPRRFGAMLAQFVESRARAINFIANLKGGRSVEEAGRHVQKFLFNYEDLTSFQKTWMRTLIPFFTWTQKNLLLQAEMIQKNPGYYQRLCQIVEGLGELSQAIDRDAGLTVMPRQVFSDQETEGRSPQLRQRFVVPIPSALTGIEGIGLTGFGTPQEGALDLLAQLGDVADLPKIATGDYRGMRLLAQSNFLIRMIAEGVTQRDVFYDRPWAELNNASSAMQAFASLNQIVKADIPVASQVAAGTHYAMQLALQPTVIIDAQGRERASADPFRLWVYRNLPMSQTIRKAAAGSDAYAVAYMDDPKATQEVWLAPSWLRVLNSYMGIATMQDNPYTLEAESLRQDLDAWHEDMAREGAIRPSETYRLR